MWWSYMMYWVKYRFADAQRKHKLFLKNHFFFIAITIWFLSSDVWYFDFGDIFFLKLRNFSVCTSMKYLMEISAFCSHKRKQCITVINIYVNILNSSFPITPCLVKILLSVGSCYHFISRQMTYILILKYKFNKFGFQRVPCFIVLLAVIKINF